MWPQSYTPIADNLALSASSPRCRSSPAGPARHPRKPAWISCADGRCRGRIGRALRVWNAGVTWSVSSALYGAAYGSFPIGWIVFTAILLYRLTVETGKFEIIKDSIASLTGDHRLQALLIAFAFGAFLEGAAGFGTPVAVAAAMLAGSVSALLRRRPSACSRTPRQWHSARSAFPSSCCRTVRAALIVSSRPTWA